MPATGEDLQFKLPSEAGFPTLREYAFANASNLEHCTKYLDQALRTFGFFGPLDLFSNDPVSVARICNCIYSLLQQRQRDMEFRQSVNEHHQRLLSDIARLEAKVEELELQFGARDREIATIRKTKAENQAALKAPDEELQHVFQQMDIGNKNKCKQIKGDDGGLIDALFLTQSDLLSLIRQIDELVVQALKVKASSKQGKKDVESFKSLLSDTLSSLKPWVQRFQNLANPSEETKMQREHWMVSQTSSQDKEDEFFEVESPEQTNFNSLVSPSPLVSWRTDFNVDRGRQLSLLTPLAVSKDCRHQKSKTFETENIISSITKPGCIPGDSINDLREGGGVMATVGKPSRFAAEPESIPGTKFIYAPNSQKANQSALLMTPCLKMSPPKSCVMLEPRTQSSVKGKNPIRISTPYPLGIHYSSDSEDPESSAVDRSDDLPLKSPQLLGVRQPLGLKKNVEFSPDSFSPPKTCVPLDLPREKLVDESCTNHNSTCAFSEPNSEPQTEVKHTTVVEDCLARHENTPFASYTESILQPSTWAGEDTLKRELWIKFEAASTQGFSRNLPTPRGTTKTGFLDMLDEVASDNETLAPQEIR